MQERAHLVSRVLYPVYATVIIGLGVACVVMSLESSEGNNNDKSGFDQGISRYALFVYLGSIVC